MRKEMSVLICLLALAFLMALTASAQQPQIKIIQKSPQEKAGKAEDWWNDPEIQKELALSKDQIAKLDAAWKKFETNRNSIRVEYRQTRQDIESAFNAEKVDAQKINALAAKLADLEGKIIKNRLAYRLEVAQILSYAQRQKLASTFKSMRVPLTPTSPAGIVSGEVE